MNDVFPSSETYDLDPRDLADLPDAEKVSVKFDASVVVLLGDERKGISDALLKGRSAVEAAAAQNIPFVPVQIVFRRRTARFDVLSPFCKVFRRRFISYGTQIYHINPREIRQKRLERNIRTVENAFNWKKFHWTPEQRRKRLNDLRASVAENGFDDRYPLAICLCRSFGIKDTLHEGHHRMLVCLSLGVARVAVKFCAASHAPRFLTPLLKPLCAAVQFFKKRNFRKAEKENENYFERRNNA